MPPRTLSNCNRSILRFQGAREQSWSAIWSWSAVTSSYLERETPWFSERRKLVGVRGYKVILSILWKKMVGHIRLLHERGRTSDFSIQVRLREWGERVNHGRLILPVVDIALNDKGASFQIKVSLKGLNHEDSYFQGLGQQGKISSSRRAPIGFEVQLSVFSIFVVALKRRHKIFNIPAQIEHSFGLKWTGDTLSPLYFNRYTLSLRTYEGTSN